MDLWFGKIISICMGINRYIMECKSALPEINASPYTELIDTLWNVNTTGQ